MPELTLKTLLACLLVLTTLLIAGCNTKPEETPASSWKVTFYESDGVTVLAEVPVEDVVELPPVQDGGLTRRRRRSPGSCAVRRCPG